MYQGASRAWSSAVGPRLERRVRPRCLRAMDHDWYDGERKELHRGLSEGNAKFLSTVAGLRLRAAVGDALSLESATCVAHLTARRSTAARSAIQVFGLPSRRGDR